VTDQELEQTKRELVRALRRRAAELGAAEQAAAAISGPGRRRAPRSSGVTSSSKLAPMRPRAERMHHRAFFVRDTFRDVAMRPSLPPALVAETAL